MRLLPVWMLAVAGWVAAAAPGLRSDDDPQGENLGPALRELARRKRATSKSNIPYSNYRPLTGIHRYRYPLYRKRSYQPQQYDYEEDVLLPEVEGDFSDYEDYVQRPSLFRERNVQQQQERKKKELLMEDDGYFTDDYAPERAALNPNRVPLRKKDYLYHLYNMPPSDLERLNYMYEIGKRDSDLLSPYDLAALEQMHAVGRKTVAPSSTEQFYNAIDSVRKKKAMYGANPAAEAAASDHLQKLKNYLTTAAGRYLEQQEAAAAARDPMIRRKRDTTSSAVGAPAAATKTNSSLATAPTTTSSSPTTPQTKLSATIPTRYQAHVAGDRKKRAFSDYFKWEKRGDDSKDMYDFLTREYFKSIARSAGQKKRKRMAYAQFEAEKRSSGIEEFLENPSMLKYMQTKLKETEEEVAREAQDELKNGGGGSDTHKLIDNIVVRLDALERMRGALSQLQQVQEQEEHDHRKRASARGAALGGSNLGPRDEQEARKRAQGARRKKSGEGRMRQEPDDIPDVFLGNTKEDCPVLERILLNCVGVSEAVGDEEGAFLHACLRHEVCYMCGSGLGVSGHECDAILSSSLEAACSRNLDCLSAAGDTFTLLSNADRYDGEGTCTHDPCVRQLLESR